jgi:hypothetical protein
VGRSLVEQLIADGHLAELGLSAGSRRGGGQHAPTKTGRARRARLTAGCAGPAGKIRGQDTDASWREKPSPGGRTFR